LGKSYRFVDFDTTEQDENMSYFQKKNYFLEITIQNDQLFPKENLKFGNNY
jgi:hypothetical protein